MGKDHQDYRPDIDGLRAFAVGIVLLFHAWPERFAFGFIGVDIFFVISGFLITGIIARKDFTFASFYQRRILRILPPLLAVLASCLVLGWMLLTPDEYERLGSHLRSSALFGANLHLVGEEGYFDVTGAQKPLLHLWSLGVEEQFYLVYPIILLLAARFSKIFFAILILAGLSLSYALFMDNGTLRFYSPLTRAFELGCGAIALLIPKNRKYACVAIAAGLFLLGSGIAFARHGMQWPNYHTLLPCIGTALLLWSEGATRLAQIVFANKLLVFIGLISYELYLWHWPLLSLGFIVTGGALSGYVKIVLLGLAFILSLLCFFLFERPIRRKYRDHWKMSVVLLVALAIVGFAGHLVASSNGFPQRVGEMKIDKTPFITLGEKYFPNWKKWTDNPNAVLLGDDPDKLDIAIIGDSHAGHLFAGFWKELAGKAKFGVFPVSGQAPWPGIATLTENFGNYRKNGYKLIDEAYATILQNKNIKTVILAHNPDCSFDDILPVRGTESDKGILLENAVRSGLSELRAAGKKVIIVFDSPHLSFDAGSIKNRPFDIFGLRDSKYRFPAKKSASMEWYETICRKVASDFDNVKIVDLYDAFCKNGECHAVLNGKGLYRDRDHLSEAGSRLAAKHILDAAKAYF